MRVGFPEDSSIVTAASGKPLVILRYDLRRGHIPAIVEPQGQAGVEAADVEILDD